MGGKVGKVGKVVPFQTKGPDGAPFFLYMYIYLDEV